MTIHKCDWCDKKITGSWIKLCTEVASDDRVRLYSDLDEGNLLAYDEKEYDICPACFEQFMRQRFIKKT